MTVTSTPSGFTMTQALSLAEAHIRSELLTTKVLPDDGQACEHCGRDPGTLVSAIFTLGTVSSHRCAHHP
eukprot:5010042-Amphidinium_carterae.1